MAGIKIPKMEIVPIDSLTVDGKNPNKMSPAKRAALKKNIERYGFIVPIITNKDGLIADGQTRLEVGKELGMKQVSILRLDVKEVDRRMLRQVLNKLHGEHDSKLDCIEFDFFIKNESFEELGKLLGKDEKEFQQMLAELARRDFGAMGIGEIGSLRKDYINPPFSVLDSRTLEWKERKSKWKEIFGSMEESREGVLKFSKTTSLKNQSVGCTSIFDPVLTEILYLWFCPTGGEIFDPFTGSPVRGVVAAIKGYKFHGIDIRKEQIEINRKKMQELKLEVSYYTGNSLELEKIFPEKKFDFVFSCPPYFNLEDYNGPVGDLSMLSAEEFKNQYKEIVRKSCAKLKENRFACFVVSEVRDKNGEYKSLVPLTIKAFKEAGLKYYNEIIFINAIGTLPLRVRRFWDTKRKIGRMHQNVLVFWKGEINKISGKDYAKNTGKLGKDNSEGKAKNLSQKGGC